MSNLPHPPAGSGDNPGSEPNKPEEPRYGQNPPQYGQNPPQYGQNPPSFGQQPSAPQYGQNPPSYGQQPQYGEGAPSYGQPPAPQYGQPQPGQSQYGQAPYGQSPYGQSQSGQGGWPSQQPAATSGVPQLVNISFWLILAAGVLNLVGIPVGLAMINSPDFTEMMNEAMEAQGGNPGIDMESFRGVMATILVVFSLIFAGLYALVAFGVRKGKNWARILGTVFAGISLLGLGSGGIGIVTILLGVAAIVLLYLPASAPYFRKVQPFANPYGQGPFNQGPYGR
ncbi:hypothetical protein BIU82_09115 [Arthrobacter sp. SW1]|uniref:hypothetical protein n=1 Tax=Arthrobacter sp. SW1 TaxID=1920889 RepID=UPI000877B845|nr:hypothetical protein [Arthrobacter sp. SW1]OFI37240.1 hypothetical protein BIU82_09115 [Arthrobacter sp. SW1]